MTTATALYDIVTTARHDGSFKILVKTFRATGLIDLLSDPKASFTLFAPGDRAFKKLVPDGVLKNLLKDKDLLTRVIGYHIIPGRRILSRHSDQRRPYRTLEGQRLLVDANIRFRVNSAEVLRADLECGNGIIHEIDSVLMPK